MIFYRTMRRPRTARAGAEKRPETAAPPGVLWQATIPGQPVRRHAAREVALVRGLPKVILSVPAALWQRRALGAVRPLRPLRPIADAVALECRVWDDAPGQPIDELLLVELLERGAVIASERQIRERRLIHARDAEHPRIELRVLAARVSEDGRSPGRPAAVGAQPESAPPPRRGEAP